MVKNILLILFFLCLYNSCSSQKCKSKVLLNGKTKVPVNSETCFNNKKYITIKPIEGVCTECIYEEVSERNDGWRSVLLIYPPVESIILVLKRIQFII